MTGPTLTATRSDSAPGQTLAGPPTDRTPAGAARCPVCAHPASERALTCPHCGEPLRRARRGALGFVALVVWLLFNGAMMIAGALAVVGIGSLPSTPDQFGQLGQTLGVGIGLKFILDTWLAGTVITGIPVILTRPTR